MHSAPVIERGIGASRSVALRTGALVAALTASMLVVGGPARAEDAARAPGDGLIAFASSRTSGDGVHNPEGDFEIFTMRADGTQVVQLTDNAAFDFAPSWAGDGQQIAFESTRDGNSDIYTMNADGSDSTNVTQALGIDSYAAFSPDGTQIAFESSRTSGDGVDNPTGDIEIFSIGVDGKGLRQLTVNDTFDRQPNWSPDRRRITYSETVGGVFRVFTMKADGSEQVLRTGNGGFFDVAPKWSPDSKRIAFASMRNGGDDIYTMKANGKDVRQLTSNGVPTDSSPSIAPDNRRIAFHSNRDGNFEIYTMSLDGRRQVNISNNAGGDFSPVWQPLGKPRCRRA